MIGLLALGLLGAGCRKPPPAAPPAPPKPSITAVSEKWQRVLPFQTVPKGLKGIRAIDCAECHRENYDEWLTSNHAAAWTDPQYQAELKKDALWACLNCHLPLENQQPNRILGLYGGDLWKPVMEPNPNFDPQLQQEGLTCAGCHVRDGAILGPRQIEAPHPMKVDPEAFTYKNCESCHNVLAHLSKAQVCSFDTVDDFKTTGLLEAGVDCVTCHMPEAIRNKPAGPKKGRLHHFLGAGLPKADQGQPVVGRSGLVAVLVPPPAPLVPGTTAQLTFTVTNALAGHSVPTGDVERFVLFQFRLLGEKGEVLWQKSERIGETWEWWPAAKQLTDNSLKRGETRALLLEVPIPLKLRAASLEVIHENHRISDQSADFMKLPASYPRKGEVSRRTYPLKLAGGRKR